MKNRRVLPLVIALLIVCAGGGILSGSQPVLLENDGLMLAEIEINLKDDAVPLSQLPDLSGEQAGEAAEDAQAEEVEEAVELYEGLNDTQIKYVEEVLALVNEARAEAGVPALTLDPALREAAQIRAAECVSTFSHTRPDGTSYKTAISEAGVTSSYTGENVATGHTSAKQVVSRWLKSEGHRANILNANYTRIGIGLEKNTGNRYQGYAWAQLFVQ